MPLDQLRCPKCKAILKPAKPIPEGQKIKCSKCGVVFVAKSDSQGDAAAKKRPAASSDKVAAAPTKGATGASSGPTPPSVDKSEEEGGLGTYGFAAGEEPVLKPPEPPLEKKKKKKRLEDEDDDEYEDEDEDEDEDEEDEEEIDPVLEMYLKVNKSNNPKGPATSLITQPSNFLIITHGLLALLQVLAFTFWIFPIIFGEHCNITPKDLKELNLGDREYSAKDWKPVYDKTWDDLEQEVNNSKLAEKTRKLDQKALDKLADMESDKRQERWIQMIFPPLLLVYCGLIVYGAVQMQSLESYNWAWTSVIMALVPAGSAGAAWVGVYWLMRLLGPVEFLDLGWGDVPYYVIFGLITAWAIFVAVYALMRMLEPVVKEAYFYVEE
jgi:DNA-directed RNA polymerase subunit M/transcription elongation factor TFIIS